MSVSRLSPLLLCTLSLVGATGCVESQATASALPGEVELVSSHIGTEGDALVGTGTLRFPWGGASQDLRYTVTGTPAAVPERYEVRAEDPRSGASAQLVFRPELGSVVIAVPGHAAEVQHNPDGSYSLGGRAYASLDDAARALVGDAGFEALSPELLATATVGLGAATRAAGTRIPDGWCDPLWIRIDPDCRNGLRTVPETYTCARWGKDSEGCSFLQAHEI